MFSDAYSGAKDPLSLAAFLHTWWLNAEEHQASYQQQDAHEFYLSALFGLGNSAASAPCPASDCLNLFWNLSPLSQSPG